MSLTLAVSGGRALPGRAPLPLLLLDADGTVRRGGPGEPFVNGPDDVEVYPEAVQRVIEWRAQPGGGRVAIVSNQGGIAAGHVTLEAVADAMVETVRQLSGSEPEPRVDVAIWCAHGVDEPCWCRKPAPGLLIAAALECGRANLGEFYPLDSALMVGDQDDDRGAAAAAGVAFRWAADWRAGTP